MEAVPSGPMRLKPARFHGSNERWVSVFAELGRDPVSRASGHSFDPDGKMVKTGPRKNFLVLNWNFPLTPLS